MIYERDIFLIIQTSLLDSTKKITYFAFCLQFQPFNSKQNIENQIIKLFFCL